MKTDSANPKASNTSGKAPRLTEADRVIVEAIGEAVGEAFVEAGFGLPPRQPGRCPFLRCPTTRTRCWNKE